MSVAAVGSRKRSNDDEEEDESPNILPSTTRRSDDDPNRQSGDWDEAKSFAPRFMGSRNCETRYEIIWDEVRRMI